MGVELPRVRDFYREKTLLITGGSGFVGKALIAKILKDLRCIRKAYVLIRKKRLPNGDVVGASRRLHEEVLRSAAFEPLKRELGEEFYRLVEEKLIPVEGDLMCELLGMCYETYEEVRNEVDIIINCAADVSFDAPIDVAIRLNTIAPLKVIEFAKSCKRKPIFIHVSTCYVNAMRNGFVDEEPLMPNMSMWHLRLGKPPDETSLEPYDVDEEVKAILRCIEKLNEEAQSEKLKRRLLRSSSYGKDKCDDELIESLCKDWLRRALVNEGMKWARRRGWNDTYTFTKAMGEQFIVRYRDDVPTVILRPAIIESGIKEPFPGWIEGLRMADPIIVGYGRGRLPDFPGDPDAIIDFVPVDFVINALICSAMLAAIEPKKLHIVHVATGSVNPLKFGELYRIGREYFLRNPLRLQDISGVPKYPEWTFQRKEEFVRKLRMRRFVISMLCQVAKRFSFVKWIRKLVSKLQTMQTALERLRYFVELYGSYTQVKARYEATNLLKLFNSLHEEDKNDFPFDVRSIDWVEYIQRIHMPGLLRYAFGVGSFEAQVMKAECAESKSLEPEGVAHEHKVRIIPDLIKRAVAISPEKVAMQIKRDGRWVRYTYRDVDRLRRMMASMLIEAGLGYGSKVLLYSENQPEWGIAYLAASSIGCTVVPVDRQMPPEYLLKVAEWVEATAIMASNTCAKMLVSSCFASQATPKLLDINNFCKPFGDESSRVPTPIDTDEYEARINPDEVASIVLLSGATQEPKGVMLSHRNFISNVLAIAELLKPTADEHFLSILPLNHTLEFTGGFLVPLYACATITYLQTLRSKAIIETMREVKATCLIAVPRALQVLRSAIFSNIKSRGKLIWALFRFLLSVSKFIYSTTGLKVGKFIFYGLQEAFGGKLKAIISGGAPLPTCIFDDLTAMGFTICEGYGLTEASPVVSVNTLERQKRGSVGLPLPGVQVRIAQPDERGVGEILVKGENVMLGYFKDEVATAQALKDGWLHTGDLGYIDANGYLHICGRLKDVIITAAGKNVYPQEVEALYGGLPDVKEMCVVGIWDEETLGETMHAVVVPDEKFWGDEKKLEEFSKHLHVAIRNISKRIPSYQRIQRVHIITRELPKTPALGIDRAAVKAMLISERKAEEGKQPTVSMRTDDELAKAVISAVSQVSRKPKELISLEDHLEFDLQIDSLARLELLLALESQLKVKLPETLMATLQTVKDIVEAIGERMTDAESVEIPQVRVQQDSFVSAMSRRRPSKVDVDKWVKAGVLKKFVRWVLRKALGVIFRFYFGFEVKGKEKLPSNAPFIIAANHCSHLDTCAVMLSLGKHASKLRILGAKDYFFNSKLRGWFFNTFLGVIPFDRHVRIAEGLQLAIEVIKGGYPLLVFPEGTRSPNGELQPFKPGVGLLGVETGVPIVPVYIDGTFEALPRDRRIPKPQKISVHIGSQIDTRQYKYMVECGLMQRHEAYKRVTARVQEAVRRLKDKAMEVKRDEPHLHNA
ncbi:MAG: hypothetical protein RUDDFDWM_001215 [Candidatus Fervidibacterota bacterium]